MSDSTPNEELPLLATRQDVVLPGVVIPLEVGRSLSLKAVDAALAANGKLVAVPQRDPDDVAPTAENLHDVGVAADVVQVSKHSARHYTVVLRTVERVKIDEVIGGQKLLVARTSKFQSRVPDRSLTDGPVAVVRSNLTAILAGSSDEPEQLIEGLDKVDDPDELVNMAAAHLELSREDALKILTEPDVLARLMVVKPALDHLAEVLRVKEDIRGNFVGQVSRETREKVLRTRMKAIREELGEEDDEAEYDDMLEQIAEADMPDEVEMTARRQVRRLRDMSSGSQEATVARTYIQWLLDLPWAVMTDDELDVAAARAILEADHAGLDKVKKRILEFIAVRKLAPDKQGPIICLVGPPGVGKTSLGRSIASSLGRKYVRISLGGVRDESEIRGHRRTYVGALPGRIVTGLKRAGSLNPVFVLDEIDKMSAGMRGDPAAAMLEVLDPEQNSEFVDHYLGVPIDLSKIMFICTANQLGPVPGPLRDRMEIVEVPGYTDNEKHLIARDHLSPRQVAEHGLEKDQLELHETAIEEIISHYTRESGVRSLEREIGALCRNAAVKIAAGTEKVRIVGDDVADILGPRKFFAEVAHTKPQIGVTTGLAWTPVGGKILFIEARAMTGKGEIKVTGQLGDVMRESVEIARSWVRANSVGLGLDKDRIEKMDLHVHVPGGAIKKDGPSAGVALAIALMSLYSDVPVRADVAMTGEVTLRGRVLPVGGIKEKVLAAHRAGIKEVILPERNRKDLPDIPETVQADLDIHFVEQVSAALNIALGPAADGSKVVVTDSDTQPLPPETEVDTPSDVVSD